MPEEKSDGRSTCMIPLEDFSQQDAGEGVATGMFEDPAGDSDWLTNRSGLEHGLTGDIFTSFKRLRTIPKEIDARTSAHDMPMSCASFTKNSIELQTVSKLAAEDGGESVGTSVRQYEDHGEAGQITG